MDDDINGKEEIGGINCFDCGNSEREINVTTIII